MPHFALCLILLSHPLLLGQVRLQADSVVLAVCFTEILHIPSSREHTFFLPAAGLFILIIVAPESNEERHSRWVWIATKQLTAVQLEVAKLK